MLFRSRHSVALIGLAVGISTAGPVGADTLAGEMGSANIVSSVGSGQTVVRLESPGVFKWRGPLRADGFDEAVFVSSAPWVALTIQHRADPVEFAAAIIGFRGKCGTVTPCPFYTTYISRGSLAEGSPAGQHWTVMPAGEYVIGLHVPGGEAATAMFEVTTEAPGGVFLADLTPSARVLVEEGERTPAGFEGELRGSMVGPGFAGGGVQEVTSTTPSLSSRSEVRRCLRGPFVHFDWFCTISWIERGLHIDLYAAAGRTMGPVNAGEVSLDWEMETKGLVDEATGFLVLMPYETP